MVKLHFEWRLHRRGAVFPITLVERSSISDCHTAIKLAIQHPAVMQSSVPISPQSLGNGRVLAVRPPSLISWCIFSQLRPISLSQTNCPVQYSIYWSLGLSVSADPLFARGRLFQRESAHGDLNWHGGHYSPSEATISDHALQYRTRPDRPLCPQGCRH